ncbi:DUF4252 domain-containing protein [Fulvivirga ligni]|uniref:DUF4252 domain-containing protein n=1 Tax=Fulvivirga ligni TaxID=2904246 RepID=UPI001F3303BD|nr:DUF4252 domain-containing protein [Fulvivirga ligni]UII23599.1 DUF4252 domain-containing protein [Fulvivirga ligni]
MQKIIFLLAFVMLPMLSEAQSETTQQFSKEHEEAQVFFFYKNTLKMLNQNDSEEFAELIKDIDKMKFIIADKAKSNVGDNDYNELVKGYKSEHFEELMTMRHQGMKVNVYIQEDDGVTTGLVFLMTDNEKLSILDVKGSVPLNKLASIISKVQEFK